jgi:cellobiose phosphorylase
MAGMAEEASRAFNAILPDTPNKPQTDTEPFIIPNYYIGPNVERRRECNLYLSGCRTGSAAWMFMTAVEGMLGAVAEYAGLRLLPCLPGGWKSASVERPFRGDTYFISYERAGDGGNRIQSVEVDGKPVEGNLIRPFGDGKRHAVRVILGHGQPVSRG